LAHTSKKLMSILLMFCMVFTFVPQLSSSALAASGSEDDSNFITFKYDSFSNDGRFIMNGSTAVVGNKLRLTPAINDQWGTAFNKDRVSLRDERSFSTYFTFEISNGGGYSVGWADGIVFTVQTYSNTAGQAGGGMGYQGIQQSVGIEFDTWNNGPHQYEPSDNHVAVNLNGAIEATNSSVVNVDKNTLNMKNGTIHVWVDFDGLNKTIEVRMNKNNNTRPADPIIQKKDLNLTQILSSDNVYVGFTAATGGAYQNHEIKSWYFTNGYDPIDVKNKSYEQAPTSYAITSTPQDDGTVKLDIQAVGGSKRNGLTLNISGTNNAIATPSTVVTDEDGKATVYMESPSGALTSKVKVEGPAGIYSEKDIQFPSKTTAPIAGNIVANATDDTVEVTGIPAGATVKIYNHLNEVISTQSNVTGGSFIFTNMTDMDKDHDISVTFDVADKLESNKTAVRPKLRSEALLIEDILSNGTKDTVFVTDVPKDAIIRVYDANSGLKITEATNTAAANPFGLPVGSGLADLQEIEVTVQLTNEFESARTPVTTILETSELPVGLAADAQADVIRVKDIPNNAKVIVYSTDGDEIASIYNRTGAASDLEVDMFPPGFDIGYQFDVSILEVDKYESAKVRVQGKIQGAPIDANDISANGSTDEVKVKDVPAGAVIRVYDEDGNLIGQAERNSDTAGEVTISVAGDLTDQQVVHVTITTTNELESPSTEATTTLETSGTPVDVKASAAADKVIVQDVPAGATVKVYDLDGNLLASGTNAAVSSYEVMVVIPGTGLELEDQVQVTITELEKHESEPVIAIAKDQSLSLQAEDIAADGTAGIVTVQNVPAGATIIVYDEDGNELGRATQGSESGPLSIEGLAGLGDNVNVSITEIGKLESDMVNAPVGYSITDPLDAEKVSANASDDTVTVRDVPPGATVTVYDEDRNVIGTATNNGETAGPVVVDIIAPGMIDGDTVKVTVRETNKLESLPVDVTAKNTPSDVLSEDAVETNATVDTVTVKDVPPSGKVTVYDEEDNIIGTATNDGDSTGDVTVDLNTDITEDDTVYVTITLPSKDESDKVPSDAKIESSSLQAEDIAADGTAGTVTVQNVPAGAIIIVYDEDGKELGRATQGPEAGPLTIDGLVGLGENVKVTVTENGKLESNPVSKPVSYNTSDPLDAEQVSANASDDTVTVQDVQPGTTVTVYDEDGNVIGTATNDGDTVGPVVVQIGAPGMNNGDIVEVSVREPNKLESEPIEVTAENAPSDVLSEDAIDTNATDDTVTVKDVPPGAIVTVYDEEGNVIGTATNDGDRTGDVIVELDIPITEDDTVYVTITLPNKDESVKVPSVAKIESSPLHADDIAADGTEGTVTVQNVPAGATIIVYDEDGNELGRVTQGSETGPLTIDGLVGLGENVNVTIMEDGKLESTPVSKEVSYNTSDPLDAEKVSANASDDTVTVRDVPPGATVTVYDKEGNVIGTATNSGGTTGPVVVDIDAPGLADGDRVKVSISEPNKLPSLPIEVTAENAPSDALPVIAIETNATDDTVTVKDVPPGATVTVYDEDGNVIGTATNNGDTTGEVTVNLAPFNIAEGDVVEVTITVPGKDESDKTTSTASEKTADLQADQVYANATADTVTVKEVPAGAEILVYNAEGELIGSFINTNDEPADVIVSISAPGIASGEVIQVAVKETGKLESKPVVKTATLEQTAAPLLENLIANATTDRITVMEVPTGATVKVYDQSGKLLVSRKNLTNETSKIEFPMNPGFTANSQFRITLTETGKTESAFVVVTAYDQSSPLTIPDIEVIDLEKDTIVVKNVPAGATVIVYDQNGNEIGRATNETGAAGEVSISGPLTTSNLEIVIIEQGKLESKPLKVDLQLTTAEQIDDALRRLSIGFQDQDTWESVTLPVLLLSIGAHETDVSWSSSKPEVITITSPVDGTIETHVMRQENDESVILTATVSKNGLSKSRTFLLIAKSSSLTKVTTPSYRQVAVNGGVDQDVTEQVDITRVTMSNGSKIDKAIFDAATATQLVHDARTANSTARIIVDELDGDEADEFAVEVPRQSLALLTANGNTLEVDTEYGRLTIDAAELARMNDSFLDLFFRVVPVKNPDMQEKLNQDIPNEPVVRNAAGSNKVEVIGTSLEIETNYSNYSTKLFIPFAKNGITVPANNVDSFIKSLRIYIEHSDGEKVVTTGTVFSEAGVPVGLEIEIDKFSTFSIIQLTANPVVDSSVPVIKEGEISKHEISEKLDSITIETTVDVKLIDKAGFVVKQGNSIVEIAEVVIDGGKLIIKLKQPIQAGYPISVTYSSDKANMVKSLQSLTIPNEAEHTAYMKGYEDGTFKPNQSIKRSEMAAILYRVNSLSSLEGFKQLYPDVQVKHWASAEIERLNDLKWLIGDNHGNFRPDDRITRAEMALVVARWLDLDLSSQESTFNDVLTNHWASGAIAAVQKAQVMTGYAGNMFKPNEYLTRAEAVTIINRALNRGELVGMPVQTWPDVSPDHWAYGHIAEASLDHSFIYMNDKSGEQFVNYK